MVSIHIYFLCICVRISFGLASYQLVKMEKNWYNTIFETVCASTKKLCGLYLKLSVLTSTRNSMFSNRLFLDIANLVLENSFSIAVDGPEVHKTHFLTCFNNWVFIMIFPPMQFSTLPKITSLRIAISFSKWSEYVHYFYW